MSRSPPTTEARARLDRHRWRKQSTNRAYISLMLPPLLATVLKAPLARHVTCNELTGCISFRFSGRRIQYWIGAKKLVVSNAIASTLYTNYTPDQLMRDVSTTSASSVFKL